MSTKREGMRPWITIRENMRSWLGWDSLTTPGDPNAAPVAVAVMVGLLRALRDRGLLSDGEIGDLFDEAAERFRTASALNLLNRVRAEVEDKDEK